MKQSEKGLAVAELIVAISIMAIVSGSAATAIFQVSRGTEYNNARMTVVRQVQNAGHWISRDTQMAQSVNTEVTSPDFLIISWTEWASNDDPIYHSTTYFFEDLTDGIGTLKRSHWSSAGANEQTLITQHIYYKPSDSDETSKVSYQTPELTLRLTAHLEETK